MHGKSQAIVRRLMASGGFTSRRGLADAVRASRLILDKAPACGCGCGEKTSPTVSLNNAAVSFLVGSGDRVPFAKFIHGHKNYAHPAGKPFSDDHHQMIIASIVGDGCLIKPTERSNHRIAWNMGNKSHALHKVDSFSFLRAQLTERANPGFGDNWYCIKTQCHQMLSNYAELYGDSKGLKETDIARELNCLGWAWYFGDDGHTDHANEICYLHTEGKSHNMVVRIRDAMRDFVGSDGVVIHTYVGGLKKRELECLRLRKNETKTFMERIAEHVAPGMEYKIIKNS